MPRRVGCDVSAFDGREKKKKIEQNEEILTPLSLFLSRLSFYSLPSCILSDDFICQFFFFFLSFSPAVCVRMRMKMEMRFFCQQLFAPKGKNFSASFLFFIHVIYMRALKDDARFHLYLSLYCLYAWKKIFYINDKSQNTKENIE